MFNVFIMFLLITFVFQRQFKIVLIFHLLYFSYCIKTNYWFCIFLHFSIFSSKDVENYWVLTYSRKSSCLTSLERVYTFKSYPVSFQTKQEVFFKKHRNCLFLWSILIMYNSKDKSEFGKQTKIVADWFLNQHQTSKAVSQVSGSVSEWRFCRVQVCTQIFYEIVHM